MYKVVVLQPGYSIVEEDGSMRANGTSTLVVSIVPCVDYHVILVKMFTIVRLGRGWWYWLTPSHPGTKSFSLLPLPGRDSRQEM